MTIRHLTNNIQITGTFTHTFNLIIHKVLAGPTVLGHLVACLSVPSNEWGPTMLECMLLNLSALNKCSPRASSAYKLLSIQVMVESNALFDFAVILACATNATILLVTNWGYITSVTQATATLVNLTSILLFLFPVTCLFHLYFGRYC